MMKQFAAVWQLSLELMPLSPGDPGRDSPMETDGETTTLNSTLLPSTSQPPRPTTTSGDTDTTSQVMSIDSTTTPLTSTVLMTSPGVQTDTETQTHQETTS